jgi:hypothetical protein
VPKTLAEWAAYIAALPADGIARKARAINSIDFYDRLREDGLGSAEAETVYVLLARRMKELAVAMPDRALYDWRALATRTPPVVVAPASNVPSDDELADFLRE